MAKKIGKISQVMGAVVDVVFEDGYLPKINNALTVDRGDEGLLVLDYFSKYQEIYNKLLKWYVEGKLVSEEDISDGLESAPASLVKILNGLNLGKQLVKL